MSIQKSYNNWAEHYDHNENKTRDLDKKSTISTLKKYSFQKVLELGCGTGKNTEWLVKRANEIICIDFSEEMLSKAQVKINSAKVKFIPHDLNLTWPMGTKVVDLVMCNLVLEHISNLNKIFAQAKKVLVPNGLFFISELHPFKQYLGSKARFETKTGVVELEVYTHHVSEYITYAKNNGFILMEIDEWFDNETEGEIPRLISLVFKRSAL